MRQYYPYNDYVTTNGYQNESSEHNHVYEYYPPEGQVDIAVNKAVKLLRLSPWMMYGIHAPQVLKMVLFQNWRAVTSSGVEIKWPRAI